MNNHICEHMIKENDKGFLSEDNIKYSTNNLTQIIFNEIKKNALDDHIYAIILQQQKCISYETNNFF